MEIQNSEINGKMLKTMEIQNPETYGKVSRIEETQNLETFGKVSKIEETQNLEINRKVLDICSGLSFLALEFSCFLSLYKWLLILERGLIGKAVNGENFSGFLLHNIWQIVVRPAFRGTQLSSRFEYHTC
jgi:hypothetical protein